MSVTRSLNSKSNVKSFTNNDIPYSPLFPVVNYQNGVTTAGQTAFNLSFSINTTVAGNHHFTLDGKLLTPGTTNDYQFTGTNAAGYSSQITLNAGFPTVPVNLNWQASLLGVKPENQFQLDNRFVQLYAAQSAGFNGFIDTSYTLAPTTTPGTPAAGTFYSTIPNRASIVDITQDLRISFGIERIQTQTIAQSQTEYGPNGEPVWATPNDTNGQIRFVGNWSSAVNTYGSYVYPSLTTDYVEISFYGTGLNLLTANGSAAFSYVYSINGASEVNFFTNTPSSIIGARNYSPNQVYPVISGLALGLNTLKIRLTSNPANSGWSGFEILNTASTTSLNVNPGNSYVGGQKLTAASATVMVYNSGFDSGTLGTRGGHVVVYQKADGTIGKAVTPTNTSSAFLTSADHTNEEIVRTYNWREFGAARSDDFSLLGTTASNVAFTLDDGTTTLFGYQVTSQGGDGIYLYNTGTYITLTFVGTGLDMVYTMNSLSATHTTEAFVDGTTVGTFSGVAFTKTQKIASGLPYGTHTIKIVRNAAATDAPHPVKFIVYQPKKPSIPTGAIELSDYNVLATYVANTVAAVSTIATGVIRKASNREHTFSGTWAFYLTGISPDMTSGFNLANTTSGGYLEYSFFGTGFEHRFYTNNGTVMNLTYSIDGSSNLSAYTTSKYQIGSGLTFTAASGLLSGTVVTDGPGGGVTVSGLPLGLHKLRILQNGTGNFYADSLDIITPIYSAKSNTTYDQQNTLPVGSNALSDNRKTSPVKDTNLQKKNVYKAVGVTAYPSTTSASFVPAPDMSIAFLSYGGFVELNFNCSTYGNTNPLFVFYVDGVQLDQASYSFSNANQLTFSLTNIVNLSPGAHKLDVYWASNGAGTAVSMGGPIGITRVFTAKQL